PGRAAQHLGAALGLDLEPIPQQGPHVVVHWVGTEDDGHQGAVAAALGGDDGGAGLGGVAGLDPEGGAGAAPARGGAGGVGGDDGGAGLGGVAGLDPEGAGVAAPADEVVVVAEHDLAAARPGVGHGPGADQLGQGRAVEQGAGEHAPGG